MVDVQILKNELDKYYVEFNNFFCILEIIGINRSNRKLLCKYRSIIIETIKEVYVNGFRLLGKPLNNLVCVLNDDNIEESVRLNLIIEYVNLMDLILRNSKRFTNYNRLV